MDVTHSRLLAWFLTSAFPRDALARAGLLNPSLPRPSAAISPKQASGHSRIARRNPKDPILAISVRDAQLVEPFFNRIKQCRRVATRYDKVAANDHAFIKTCCHPDLATRV
jgi:hypothetical protein